MPPLLLPVFALMPLPWCNSPCRGPQQRQHWAVPVKDDDGGGEEAEAEADEGLNPIICLIEARLLVDECVPSGAFDENRVLPYLESLVSSIAALRERLKDSGDLNWWLEKNRL